MIVVNVAIESSEADISALKPAIAAMEQASRAEAGCDDYTFSIELNNPDMPCITERWQSMEALETHFQALHMAEFQAAIAQHAPKSTQAYFYDASEVSPPGG